MTMHSLSMEAAYRSRWNDARERLWAQYNWLPIIMRELKKRRECSYCTSID